MAKKAPLHADKLAAIRLQAQARLNSADPFSRTLPVDADTERLLHELQVQQVELEMQNTELLLARSKAEALLEQYTDLYDFAPVGYCTLDSTGRVKLVNLTATRHFGAERSKMIGRPLVSFIALKDRLPFQSFFARTFSGQPNPPCEFTLEGSTGSGRLLSLGAVVAHDRSECRAVVMDVTEQRQSQERVRISEIRYRRLFETAHDGVLLIDPTTRKITDANPFMTELLSYTREEFIGKELYEIGLLHDQQASQQMFLRLTKTRRVRYEDLPLKSRAGKHKQVEVVANLYDENGHPVIQCNIRDITTRKAAERVLQRNETLFSALIEQAPMGVYVIDAEFRLQQVNRLAQPVFASVRPLIGRDFSEVHHLLWPKSVSDKIVARFRRTLATGETYKSPQFHERRRDTGNREAYEWQIQRVTLPAGEFGVVAFFHDVTERIKAEEIRQRVAVLAAENRKANQEIARRRVVEAALIKSEKAQRGLLSESRELHAQLRLLTRQIMSAQEDERKAISRALHDEVMQILVSINVELAVLSQGATRGGADLPVKIARTHQAVESAVKAVHQFARDLRPSVLDDFGLIPALHTYIETLERRHGFHIELSAFKGADTLNGDAITVLFRIAQEALNNVGRHAGATEIKVSLRRAGSGIRMVIADNGKAFPVAKVMSARNPKRLGLVGMKERAEMVGGTLKITSVTGRGTTVTVTIPCAEPDPKATTPVPRAGR